MVSPFSHPLILHILPLASKQAPHFHQKALGLDRMTDFVPPQAGRDQWGKPLGGDPGDQLMNLASGYVKIAIENGQW